MSLKVKIFQHVRQDIVQGALMPGEKITESGLAKRFACSRSPVREALSLLERQGFVEISPNQGAIITKISPEEVSDYYGLLRVLEAQAVLWATPLLTAKHIERLVRINTTMKKISPDSQGAIEKWVNLNAQFHQVFRHNCGNRHMEWLVSEVRARITRWLYTSVMVPVFDDYLRDHEVIIAAVRQDNARKASKAMADHIMRAQKILERFFGRIARETA